jgi:hypothetical protein
MANQFTPTYFKITDPSFDYSKIEVAKVKYDKKFVKLSYEKNLFAFNLPKLEILFDTKVNQFGKLELSLSLKNSPEIEEKIKEFDTKIVDIIGNAGLLDGDEVYTPFLKENNKYPPYIKFNIPVKDSVFTTDFYSGKKNPITINSQNDVTKLLQKNNTAATSAEVTGVWFMTVQGTKKWGVTFRLSQCLVKTLKQEPVEDQFLFEDSSDSSSIENGYLFDD